MLGWNAEDANQPLVRIADVSKSYGPVPALHHLDLAVPPGETVALLGPNGAGKSTTVHLMLGLRRPDRGTVEVAGAAPNSYHARSRSGVVLQNSGLPGNLRVHELVSLFCAYYPDPMSTAEAMAKAGVEDLAGRYFGDLSGGQQQRVYLALAVCGRPQLLVLDEPSVGLDLEARARLRKLLTELAGGGCAIVLATHNLEEADALADRVVLLASGRVAFDGPPGAMKSLRTLRHVVARTPPLDEAVARTHGVTEVTYRDGVLSATTDQPERLVRALLDRPVPVADLEVRGVRLDEAVDAVLRGTADIDAPDSGRPPVATLPAAGVGGTDPRHGRRDRISLRPWLRMISAQTRAEFLKLWRDLTFVVVTCLMPTIFFALFGTSSGAAPEDDLRGVAALSAYGAIGVGLFGFGVGIAAERGMRWDLLIRATPIRIGAYLAARVVPAACFTVLTLGVLAGYAVVVTGVSLSWLTWLTLAAGLTVGNVVFIALGLAIGYNLPPRAAMPVATVVYLPLSLASGLLVPIDQLPGYVRAVSEALPAWHYARIGWSAMGLEPGFGLTSALALALYTAGFLVLAVIGYRREVRTRYL